jgi:uncharacterized ion transporter superfamily protein YfcC
MWLSAIKLAVSAGSKIYANKQKTKMAMSDAQLMHASRMAEGKEAYQGKLLEARQSDWKDEAVLIILSLPIAILAWAVVSDDPGAMDKVKLFFRTSKMVYKFMDPCRCKYLWYKGNTNI